MNRKLRYLGQHDHEEIERLHNRGATVAVIADKIGEHAATIYRELQEPWKVGADEMTETDCYATRIENEKIDKEQMAIERFKDASEMSLAVYGLPKDSPLLLFDSKGEWRFR